MHFYDFVGYCSMLTDERRVDAYVNALKKTINEDSIVLDLGAGTGIFSILACDYGAKKVYSVEVNPLIKLLNDVIEDRGYESRIEVIQEFSNKIELDEKANLLISDIHGGFPLFESSIETMIDARERLLTKDAIIFPKKETIYFAVSQAEEIYENNVKRYLKDFYGFSIPSAERLVFNRWFSAKSKTEKLLSDPGVFGEIDYRTITEPSFSQEFRFEIKEDGIAHGLRGWFENELVDGIGVSNSIDVEKTTYSSPFFPFEREVEVKAGDVVSALISARYEKGDYAWSWKTEFFEKGDPTKPITQFNQSVLASMFMEPSVVLKQSEYFVPKQNEAAEIDSLILNSIDGEAMNGDIADLLLEKYPKVYKSFESALNYVAAFSQKYSV
ncbi:MAG: 50S ribosomal protein L11 methyltransferase [Acidobacteria bacterium]|nr:50S ribosomal protein L11 methyltransferase [Acidobacteriota bacterium]